MLTLYGRTNSSITLPEAIKNCASALSNGSEGVALLYSPVYCQFAKLQLNGTLTNSQGKSVDLSPAFEARVFNKTSELRWLNESNSKGQAVLLSELDISGYLTDCIPDLQILDTIPQDYLLWGRGAENSSNPGWGKLASARIGSISVPVTGLTANKRVYLKAREYLGEVDEYGNVAVVEERLTELEVR